ncbi:MAG: hypothetical protein GF372_08860, partial [Candidatus Marinimicrobia bacterium]|nr:hypothetical protein [Candidatus Neomarinimicrobiota bacterium]
MPEVADNVLNDLLEKGDLDNSTLSQIETASGKQLEIYPKSINKVDNTYFFIAKNGTEKAFYILADKGERAYLDAFDGVEQDELKLNGAAVIKECPMHHENAEALRAQFAFTKAVVVGLTNSYGLGDRLGLANPGHLRAIQSTDFKPVLAQQSIRELERTNRNPDEVMDTASWAVFQEGYKDGFGSDADHLKTPED